MPKPKTLIDLHPKKQQIIAEILKGTAAGKIAVKYKTSSQAIYRYRHDKLAEKLAEELKKQDKDERSYILSQLESLLSRSWKLADAIDEELSDPDNPDKYYIGPRAHDVQVVYFYNGKKRKGNLQTILNQITKKGYQAVASEYKIADPRMLHVRNVEALTKSIVALSKITGHIQEIKINVTQTEEWTIIKNVILQATEKYPEAREDIIAKLKQADNGS